MQRGIVGLLAMASACGFAARSNPAESPGGPRDAAVDVPPVDGNDAMASSRRRKTITFDHNRIAATLTDFPAWIDLTDGDIAARAQPDGSDIYFTASDGATRLDYELQAVDVAAHHFSAWVRIPTLDGTVATVVHVEYGDRGAAPGPRPAGVFKSSYAAVWHLDDALPVTTIADATGLHAGTPVLTAATTTAAGKLGRGLAFTAAQNDRIEFTNPLTGDNPHTISVWVNQAANLNHIAAIVVMGTPTTGNARWLHGHYTNSSVAIGYFNLDSVPSPAQVIDGANWTQLTWVFEGNNRKNRLYRNGVEVPPQFLPGPNPAINTTGTAGFIGYAPMPAYGGNNAYDGTIDELRIATTARSAEWVATEYANQSSPSTFYAVGPELVP